MFTGIIETVGKVTKLEKSDNYLILGITHSIPQGEIKIGDSIACDGACLTVVKMSKNELLFEVSQETLAKTTTGNYEMNTRVNLERALQVGDRMDGHFVTGHIDDSGEIESVRQIGKSVVLTIKHAKEHDRHVVDKGSLAVNGVSLTVNDSQSGQCSVNLIPHTLEQTNLSSLKIGDKVNLEFDLIGKYALKANSIEKERSLTFAKLEESGW